MKHHLSIIFFMISAFGWCQSRYNVIHKAERKIEQKKYEKALKLLDKAEKMDYGFCGNAWIEADAMIVMARARVYSETNQYEMAANTLNEAKWDYLSGSNDSLKTVYFVKAFGKELVKHEIDSCIALITSEQMDSTAYLEMTFEFDVSFSNEPFKINYLTLKAARHEMLTGTDSYVDMSMLERFKITLRAQPFYQVLKE